MHRAIACDALLRDSRTASEDFYPDKSNLVLAFLSACAGADEGAAARKDGSSGAPRRWKGALQKFCVATFLVCISHVTGDNYEIGRRIL